jgi:hypothetical protein
MSGCSGCTGCAGSAPKSNSYAQQLFKFLDMNDRNGDNVISKKKKTLEWGEGYREEVDNNGDGRITEEEAASYLNQSLFVSISKVPDYEHSVWEDKEETDVCAQARQMKEKTRPFVNMSGDPYEQGRKILKNYQELCSAKELIESGPAGLRLAIDHFEHDESFAVTNLFMSYYYEFAGKTDPESRELLVTVCDLTKGKKSVFNYGLHEQALVAAVRSGAKEPAALVQYLEEFPSDTYIYETKNKMKQAMVGIGPRLAPALLASLSGGQVKNREAKDAMTEALAALGEQAVPLIVQNLASVEDNQASDDLIGVLRNIGQPAAPYVLEGLDVATEKNKPKLIALLADLGDTRALPLIGEEGGKQDFNNILRAEKLGDRAKAGQLLAKLDPAVYPSVEPAELIAVSVRLGLLDLVIKNSVKHGHNLILTTIGKASLPALLNALPALPPLSSGRVNAPTARRERYAALLDIVNEIGSKEGYGPVVGRLKSSKPEARLKSLRFVANLIATKLYGGKGFENIGQLINGVIGSLGDPDQAVSSLARQVLTGLGYAVNPYLLAYSQKKGAGQAAAEAAAALLAELEKAKEAAPPAEVIYLRRTSDWLVADHSAHRYELAVRFKEFPKTANKVDLYINAYDPAVKRVRPWLQNLFDKCDPQLGICTGTICLNVHNKENPTWVKFIKEIKKRETIGDQSYDFVVGAKTVGQSPEFTIVNPDAK